MTFPLHDIMINCVSMHASWYNVHTVRKYIHFHASPLCMYTDVSAPPPTQLFIDFRDTSAAHMVSITCPLLNPNLPTMWFRNGVQMAGSVERNLVRTDEDPVSLYGVYQCLVGQSDPYQQSVGNTGRNIFTTVARVMPYGKQSEGKCLHYSSYRVIIIHYTCSS